MRVRDRGGRPSRLVPEAPHVQDATLGEVVPDQSKLPQGMGRGTWAGTGATEAGSDHTGAFQDTGRTRDTVEKDVGLQRQALAALPTHERIGFVVRAPYQRIGAQSYLHGIHS